MTSMTKADRGNLERLARKRAKVAQAMIGERVNVLRAEVEDQLTAEHKFDDALWAEVTAKAQQEVAKADAAVATVCRGLGIGADLRPSLSIGWAGRGENAQAGRRAELRKLAHARIDSAAASAKVAIEHELLKVETELIRDGLETADAVAFVEAMPTPEQLLPSVDIGELAPSEQDDTRRSRYSSWEPPQQLTGQLLTPSSASTREAKRQAIVEALAANPAASDREIGRWVGADHHTVGNLRGAGGELPTPTGELPTESGGSCPGCYRAEVPR